MAGKGGGAWKVAYADFVTAMMAFFMVMWLISQDEKVKVGDAPVPPRHEQYFKEYRPMIQEGDAPIPLDPKKQAIRKSHTVSLFHGDRSMVGTAILFDEKSVELNDEAQETLRGFAPLVRGKPQKLEIRGHAARVDSDEAGTDVWQLSYQRCLNTLKFLEQQGIAAQHMRLSQAGCSEPYTIGHSPERLVMNSRVEVFLLNEVADDARGTVEEREQRFQTPTRRAAHQR
jgi:chemotaxis protein MotB